MSRDIIGIAGLKRSGKDTIANFLGIDYHFQVHHLADPLKEGARCLGWDGTKDNTEFGRPFLEWLGMDVFKGKFGRDYFARLLFQKGFQHADPVAIPDVRDKEEAEYIQAQGGKILLVTRTHPEHLQMIKEQPSISDDRLKLIVPDYEIINDGTEEDLRKKVRKLMRDEFQYRAYRECFKFDCTELPNWLFSNEGTERVIRLCTCEGHKDECLEIMFRQINNDIDINKNKNTALEIIKL